MDYFDVGSYPAGGYGCCDDGMGMSATVRNVGEGKPLLLMLLLILLYGMYCLEEDTC